jgi:hypothetical protein
MPPCPAPQERLRLRGWADAGGAFFRVEASSDLMPDSVSVFEAEALLIAPGGGWAPERLRLFGLESELEVRRAGRGGLRGRGRSGVGRQRWSTARRAAAAGELALP